MSDVLLSDIDGTVVDSNALHAEAWRRAFEHFGIEVGMDEAWSQIGKGGDQLIPVFVPEADRERVFERYYRGSNTSGIVGSGVGLSLVKTIADLHKGALALHSREGEGSRFTVRLPALAAEAQALCAEAESEMPARGSIFS